MISTKVISDEFHSPEITFVDALFKKLNFYKHHIFSHFKLVVIKCIGKTNKNVNNWPISVFKIEKLASYRENIEIFKVFCVLLIRSVLISWLK